MSAARILARLQAAHQRGDPQAGAALAAYWDRIDPHGRINPAAVTLRQAALAAMERAARGSYQLDAARGHARWSGSDLRGAAARYSAKYARSRAALLARADAILEEPGGLDTRLLFTREGRRWTREAVAVTWDGIVVPLFAPERFDLSRGTRP